MLYQTIHVLVHAVKQLLLHEHSPDFAWATACLLVYVCIYSVALPLRIWYIRDGTYPRMRAQLFAPR